MLHHVCDVAYGENMCEPIKTRKCRNTNWLINYMHSWQEFAEGVLQVVLFTVLWFKSSMEKYCVGVLLAIWEIFLHEDNRNNISKRFSYKFALILFLSFVTNQKQELGFQQVVSLVTRNISAFCLKRVALYFKAMPNSIDFGKGIFLHVIPVRIIAPWYMGCFA